MFLVQLCQLLELHNLTQINLGQSCKHLTYETTHLQPISIYCDFRSFLKGPFFNYVDQMFPMLTTYLPQVDIQW